MMKMRAPVIVCALFLATPVAAQSPAHEWQPVRSGIEMQEIEPEAGHRFRLIAVRIDPRRVRFSFTELPPHPRGWTIARSPDSAVVALNVGQFTGTMPWGWIVNNGREVLRPGHGPLSTAVVIDSTGAVHFIDAADLPKVRASRTARIAFQSYPSLLVGNGEVPDALKASGRGVDLEHRDSRLAIGLLRDGRVLIVLTRFSQFEGMIGALPIGPTVPEMAELMKLYGCVKAVMLDGGISGQLLLRTANRTTLSWPGWRKVPLGLTATPR